MVIESLKLDFDVCGLHDLVNFTVLLSTNELAVFVGQFNLEADLVVESLKMMSENSPHLYATPTLMMSSSMIMLTAARTSCSSPCISKHILLNTTSAPVAMEICFRSVVKDDAFKVAGGRSALNCTGNNQNDPT